MVDFFELMGVVYACICPADLGSSFPRGEPGCGTMSAFVFSTSLDMHADSALEVDADVVRDVHRWGVPLLAFVIRK